LRNVSGSCCTKDPDLWLVQAVRSTLVMVAVTIWLLVWLLISASQNCSSQPSCGQWPSEGAGSGEGACRRSRGTRLALERTPIFHQHRFELIGFLLIHVVSGGGTAPRWWSAVCSEKSCESTASTKRDQTHPFDHGISSSCAPLTGGFGKLTPMKTPLSSYWATGMSASSPVISSIEGPSSLWGATG
jgi:hypothetical protein